MLGLCSLDARLRGLRLGYLRRESWLAASAHGEREWTRAGFDLAELRLHPLVAQAMTFIRPKPKSPKLGLREPAVLYSQKHRQWIRRFACVVPGCDRLPIECMHVRLGLPARETAGMAQKPSDVWVIPGCAMHHRGAAIPSAFPERPSTIHGDGEASFAKHYGLDLPKLCIQYASKSPDPSVRERAEQLRSLV